VHQSKLYYLRDLSGKAARIKEREGDNAEGAAEGNGELASGSQEMAAATAAEAVDSSDAGTVVERPSAKKKTKDKEKKAAAAAK
jgi:hypothetical protein